MLHWAEYVKFFVALAVIVNPISALPLFISMTAENSEAEKRQIARTASISVAVVLVLAAILGQPILALFGITIASFKVGGAILILLMAISMILETSVGRARVCGFRVVWQGATTLRGWPRKEEQRRQATRKPCNRVRSGLT